MNGTQARVFVSHAPGDRGLAGELFATAGHFPFGVTIVGDAIEAGHGRAELECRLASSDVLVPVVTEEGAGNPWIDQEIGYAIANDVPVVPAYEREGLRAGYVASADGVRVDREDRPRTIHALLTALRDELAPLGGMSVPNWYLRFPCERAGCDEAVTLAVDDDQSNLWRLHEHGGALEAACDACGRTYAFDPATTGLLARQERRS